MMRIRASVFLFLFFIQGFLALGAGKAEVDFRFKQTTARAAEAWGFKKTPAWLTDIKKTTTDDEGFNWINGYKLSKAKLGEGTFGAVFVARKERGVARYAVKQILKSTIRNPDHARRLIVEKDILETLSKDGVHPNVGGFIEAFVSEDHVNFVLELCSGIDLFEFLKLNGPLLPEKLARLVIYEIAKGLRHIHMQGVAYRDLKPENVMIHYIPPYDNHRGRLTIKLIDFGLAFKTDDPGPLEIAGTPEYMDPNLALAALNKIVLGPYGAEGDMWALGVLWTEVLLHGVFQRGLDREDENKFLMNYFERVAYPESYNVKEKLKEKQAKYRYSDEAINLIIGLLNPNRNERLTADGLLANPYFADLVENDAAGKGVQIELPDLDEDNDENVEQQQVDQYALAFADAPIEPHRNIRVSPAPSLDRIADLESENKAPKLRPRLQNRKWRWMQFPGFASCFGRSWSVAQD
jgi:serine/threonine protein kinase